MPKKEMHTKLIIVISLIALVVIASGITVYFVYSNAHAHGMYQRSFMRGNFTFNNETLTQTISILNTESINNINSYCQQGMNMFYCRYYCTKINPDNQICSQLPMSHYNNNFTGAPPQ
jgi:hypothetical protein